MTLMGRMPGWGIVKGMWLTLRRMIEPKATIQYPEERAHGAPKGRGRLILLFDEYGNLKCETCFQCAMSCPIEIIDMGGVDTKNRYHVHWGPPEQYGERREESALRRSGRPVPDASFTPWSPIDLGPLDRILQEEAHDPHRLLTILERTQEAYGHLPVAAMQHISFATSAWYSEIYGVATSYPHFRLEPPQTHVIGVCRCTTCLLHGAGQIRDAFEAGLGTAFGGLSPDGAVRLEGADCQGDPPHPLVVVDGQRLPSLTPEQATDIVAQLRAPFPDARPA